MAIEKFGKPRTYLIFHCEQDNSWTVAVSTDDEDLVIGVADCPNAATARIVLEAMVEREKRKHPEEVTE